MYYYPYVKAAHIVFMVSWFAGLFYTPRLFIYVLQASKKTETERNILTVQLTLMARKLWFIITWPAALLTAIFGIWLMVLNPGLIKLGWFHTKLLLVVILVIYHLKTHHFYIQIKNGTIKRGGMFMKFWNEVATLLLFAIVFTAILKNNVNWIFQIIGTLALIALIVMGIKLYNRRNES